MNMEEYVQALEIHVASRKLILGDGESVLSLLYEAYGDINPMYDDQIKADFAELYQASHGIPLRELDWIVGHHTFKDASEKILKICGIIIYICFVNHFVFTIKHNADTLFL